MSSIEACSYCGHPRENHPKTADEPGIRCNGVTTRNGGSLCSDCNVIAELFRDRTTTIGIIWANIFEDAIHYFLPGTVYASEWSHNESRAAAWADMTASHIYDELERNKAES
ncbi:hypothetical protein ACFYP4_02850 [Streptomyces sp. NPDC005551]|uniref:hypothetical protein n=1 Tax=Streptomyces sp. NPDC005551 TaxID=3364725 RepID=UPI0036813749